MDKQNTNHKNCFNFLRLFFSIFVLITHSYVLSGNTLKEPLALLSKGQVNFSYIGLRGFFIISGFLIFQSFVRSNNLFDFLWKRIVRIFPGLIAVSLISVFIICPILSNLSLKDFFSNKNIYLTFFESIDPLIQKVKHPNVVDVFKNNIYTDQLNGSLWTISYEFLFYLGISIMFVYKSKKFQLISLLIVVVSLLFFKIRYVDPWFKYDIYILNSKFLVKALLDFLLFFLSGALFSAFGYYNLKIKTHKFVVVSILILIIILIKLNLFSNFYLFVLTPFVLSLGHLSFGKYDITQKIGDISYGIYLSSFFIQQVIVSFFDLNVIAFLLLSLCLSISYGFLSWNFVEKKALLKKNYFKNFKFGRA